MSEKFQTVKKYYDAGAWDLARVKKAVEKGWITEAEYKTLTGQEYK